MTAPALNTRIIWSVLALLTAADAIGLKMTGLHVIPHALLPNVITLFILTAISGVYTYARPSERIAGMVHMMAVLFFFATASVIATYITASFHQPLIDASLAAADHALGLDWMASYKWLTAHRLLYNVLYAAYASLAAQLVLMVVILNFTGRCGRGWEMLWLFMVSCILCLVFSALWPAAGAFGYYHVETDRAYVQVFMALHDGTLKVIGDKPAEGIIQFPSFHVAMGLFFPYVVRGMKKLFPVFVVLNALLFVATPHVGGHHFSDVFAGALLSLVTIFIVKKAVAAGLVPDTEKIANN